MSSDETAIEFADVTKRYSRYAGILQVKNLLDRLRNGQIWHQLAHEPDLYALKNLSLRIRKGERVGIIGANGAGKSTTLKLIQGVSHPTSGRVMVDGKVGGLIELGAGFHPELSGRQNVYLNASLNGVSRRQTDELIGRIIEIAGIDQFIDVPIKRYSSGMKARLGFALCMTFTPDIVLLDEVLAVGDARFRQRSVKMIEQYLAGRTVVFVSHAMTAVRQVCDRVLVLDGGELTFDGAPDDAIEAYESVCRLADAQDKSILIQRGVKHGFAKAPPIEIVEARFLSSVAGDGISCFEAGARVRVGIKLQGAQAGSHSMLRVQVKNSIMDRFTDIVSGADLDLGTNAAGLREGFVSFSTAPLRNGNYVLELIAEQHEQPLTAAVVLWRKPFAIVSSAPTHGFGLIDLSFAFSSAE